MSTARVTTNAPRLAHLAARIAVQLAREEISEYRQLERIATDALMIAQAGLDARKRLLAQKDAAAAYARAEAVLSQYDAEAIKQGELQGMVLGAKFRSGRHTSGFRNVFFVV